MRINSLIPLPLWLAAMFAFCPAPGEESPSHSDPAARAKYTRKEPPIRSDPVARAKYTPYPEDGYPQIIQKDDYATIEAIETLYRQLATIAPVEKGKFGLRLTCDIAADRLTFRSQGEESKSVVLSRPDPATIVIGNRRFTEKATTILFSTLFKVLADLAEQGKCESVRCGQFNTRVYKPRTVIEFHFAARIVLIDSLSNGPVDEERLYILDLLPKETAFFNRL